MVTRGVSMADDRGEKSFDPGAARHGNFINYYEFNPPENRTQLLGTHLGDFVANEIGHADVACLDVGCNTGVSLTFQVLPIFVELPTHWYEHFESWLYLILEWHFLTLDCFWIWVSFGENFWKRYL